MGLSRHPPFVPAQAGPRLLPPRTRAPGCPPARARTVRGPYAERQDSRGDFGSNDLRIRTSREHIMSSHYALAAPFLLASALALLWPQGAAAQNYPDRAVKIIVPIGPAGSYDLVGRVVGDALSKRLGQSV